MAFDPNFLKNYARRDASQDQAEAAFYYERARRIRDHDIADGDKDAIYEYRRSMKRAAAFARCARFTMGIEGGDYSEIFNAVRYSGE